MEKLFQKLARYFLNLWDVGILHPEKGLWTIDPSLDKIPYLKAQNAHGCHILIKSLHPAHYLLADDIDSPTLSRHHRLPDGQWKPARMIVETSPGNFQVWIHSKRPLSLEEKLIWLKKMQSDPAAHPHNRWGRCPGFRNRKEKYRTPEGQYPLSSLIWIDWNSLADIPQLLPTKAPPPQDPLSHPSLKGAVCHHRPISRRDYLRSNESQTDFAYTLALARRGYSDQQITERLLTERTCWENHRGGKKRNLYLERTIRRAREIIQSTGNSGCLPSSIGTPNCPCTDSSIEPVQESQNKVQIPSLSPE